MTRLMDTMTYFCTHYPHKRELGVARLSNMAYLADWRSAKQRGRPLTGADWEFRPEGPRSGGLVRILREHGAFSTAMDIGIHGEPVEVVKAVGTGTFPSLSEDDRGLLDGVIKESAAKEEEALRGWVFSTEPILTCAAGLPVDFRAPANGTSGGESG